MSDVEAVPVLHGEILVEAGSEPNGAKVHEDTKPTSSAVPAEPIKCDVIVVGAGFSGITAIDRFRRAGMNVKCFESGSGLGGVWYWNRYPGARVDSEVPFYQLNIPEVYKTWEFSQRFPDHRELRRYMVHIDRTLNISKDVYFDARVDSCTWDDVSHSWTVKTRQGHVAVAKYLVACSGVLHRTYTPDFPGLNEYKGQLFHSGAWDESFDGQGKNIAIIGSGATAVQITQELGKVADQLTVFLRRPSLCQAMCQRELTARDSGQWKPYLPILFKTGRESYVGLPAFRRDCAVQDCSPEERERHWEEIWSHGGFNFGIENFNNVTLDKEANRLVYNFWRKKVCQRLTDPKKNAIMAPEEPPFYYGTKRAPLEQDYYEILNQPNVHIHDLKASPLTRFNPSGIQTSDGTSHDFDAVVLATGFDSYLGSLGHLGLRSRTGTPLEDLWESGGVNTYLGLAVAGFPNFFMAYTPQSPAAASNGTTLIEVQIECIVAAVVKLEAEGAVAIEPTLEAQAEYRRDIDGMVARTLFPYTDSWWNGTNIPGRKGQNLMYLGGLHTYEKHIRSTFDGWKGFRVETGAA